MDDRQQHLQLQIPNFIYNTAPTLVPGGGAEVIPLANNAWFATNGFQLTPNQFFQQSSTTTDYHQQTPGVESSSAPFDFSDPPPPPSSFSSAPPPSLPPPDFSIFLKQPAPPQNVFAAPSSLGLPVYSTSGFDLMSIFGRVNARQNPKVVLGPVDMTCSFVVVDVRRYDQPIIYCSPTFRALTGYREDEILGRNCRFLQSPTGNVQRGEARKHTSLDAVALLRKSLTADKECQTSIVNYKKDGTPFINLVTVIPVPGGVSGASHEKQDYAYHVGFQVDLTKQPHAILEKLRDGSYIVDYGVHSNLAHPQGLALQMQSIAQQSQNSSRDRKINAIPPAVMSKELKRLMADPALLRAIPLSVSTTFSLTNPSTSAVQEESAPAAANNLVNLVLLEAAPDFVHVVSLKGNFLYVAPSVRRVLGYEPEEMVGTSISDYAHPEDVVPLMRELKDGSATTTGLADNAPTGPTMPRSVDLLFRAKTKMGRYVWVECRGRLHVEPGKGRKAIILSGRAREMANLKWEDVKRAGGLARSIQLAAENGKQAPRLLEREVWGTLGGNGKDTMAFMAVGESVNDVLGWTSEDLVGRSVGDFVVDEADKTVLGGIISNMRASPHRSRLPDNQPVDDSRMKKIQCSLRKKDDGVADVFFIIYRADLDQEEDATGPSSSRKSINKYRGASCSISQAPLVFQIRLVAAETLVAATASMIPSSSSTSSSAAFASTAESSSSLTGAVPDPPLSSSSSLPSSDLCPPVDVFEELAISRGSSWQYELQQLRFANVRLQEELTALEAADASVQVEGNSSSKESEATSPRSTSDVQAVYGYEPLPSTYGEQYPHIFAEPIYSIQPTPEPRPPRIKPPYSVEALKLSQAPPHQTGQSSSRRTQQHTLHPRPPSQIQQDWPTMATAHATTTYVPPNAGSTLKRSWDSGN